MRRALACLVLASGCTVGEIDFSRSGLFACDRTADAPCDNDGVCSVGRCYAPDAQPRVEIVTPEVPAFSAYDPEGGDIPVSLRLLTDAGVADEDLARSFGSVEVEVDGVVVATVDEQDGASGLDVAVTVPNRPGVHRISARLTMDDGTAYDNDAAFARLLYFVAVDQEPYVGLLRPWPGERFDTDVVEIDVQVQGFNFSIVPAGIAKQEGQGHAHVHYDDDVTVCHQDRACDAGPIAIIDQARDDGVGGGAGLLPEADVGPATVGVLLRNVDHAPYGVPYAACNGLEVPEDCGVVTDTIQIERVGVE